MGRGADSRRSVAAKPAAILRRGAVQQLSKRPAQALLVGIAGVRGDFLHREVAAAEQLFGALQMHAADRIPLEVAECGDIVAIIGIKDVFTGDTLCDPDQPILLEKYLTAADRFGS